MLLQATLNGGLSKRDHPAVPVSGDELADDAAACVAVGADAIHLHPRDAAGRESLDPELVDSVVATVRSRCGVPVGVTTGRWIEPDLARRVEGVWSIADAERLARSSLGNEVLRIMIEPVAASAASAVAVVNAIHDVLDSRGLTSAPRLQHGDGEATWVLLGDAVERGIDTRIGLEDTLLEPGGLVTTGNAALVQSARTLMTAS